MCFSALIFIGLILAGKKLSASLSSMHRPAPASNVMLSIPFF